MSVHLLMITPPQFQSTLLMRGATQGRAGEARRKEHFNPRSSCEERHEADHDSVLRSHISIHAPHARSDPPGAFHQMATEGISIHAPHARSDSIKRTWACLLLRFQSTLLMRGATLSYLLMSAVARFQSTLLMRGATQDGKHRAYRWTYFNPRSSCEERPLPAPQA